MNGAQTVGVFALCGLGIGVMYGVLRALRRATGGNRLLTALTDALFWIAAVSGMWACVIRYYDGRARMFEFLAALMGLSLYFITISKPIEGVFYAVIENILKFLKFILKILLTPALFLYKIIGVCLNKIYTAVKRGKEGRKDGQDDKKDSTIPQKK